MPVCDIHLISLPQSNVAMRQRDVSDIKMAVDRQIVGDTMDYQVDFIHQDTIYRLNLIYSSELDPRYGEYAGEFYKTIKMNE